MDVVARRLLEKKLRLGGNYVNTRTKAEILCLICGYKWSAFVTNVLHKSGCPQCSGKARLSLDAVREKLLARGIFLLEKKTIRSDGRPKFRCSSCTYEWAAILDNVLNKGSGCPKCAGNAKYTEENIKDRLKLKGIRLIRLGLPSKRSKFMCKVCKHTWMTFASNVIHRSGCPKCAIQKSRFTREDFDRKLEKHSVRFIKRAKQKIIVECKKCSKKWKTYLKRPSKCTTCYTRFGATEQEIRNVFERITGLKFPKARPRWLKGRSRCPLELDGYNEKHKIAFEYQGIHHYEPIFGDNVLRKRKLRDKRKRELCRSRGVLLICIPYWKENIEGFIRKKLWKSGLIRL